MVEKRNARVLSLVHAPRGFKANQIQQISRRQRRSNGLPPGRSGQGSCQSNERRRSKARSPARRLTTSKRQIPEQSLCGSLRILAWTSPQGRKSSSAESGKAAGQIGQSGTPTVPQLQQGRRATAA